MTSQEYRPLSSNWTRDTFKVPSAETEYLQVDRARAQGRRALCRVRICSSLGFLLVGRFGFHQFLSVSPPDHLGRRQPGVRVEPAGQRRVGSVQES